MLLNNVWHSAMVELGCVTPTILWVKVYAVVGYDSNEGDCEERDRFWNDMDKNLGGVGHGYRL